MDSLIPLPAASELTTLAALCQIVAASAIALPHSSLPDAGRQSRHAAGCPFLGNHDSVHDPSAGGLGPLLPGAGSLLPADSRDGAAASNCGRPHALVRRHGSLALVASWNHRHRDICTALY